MPPRQPARPAWSAKGRATLCCRGGTRDRAATSRGPSVRTHIRPLGKNQARVRRPSDRGDKRQPLLWRGRVAVQQDEWPRALIHLQRPQMGVRVLDGWAGSAAPVNIRQAEQSVARPRKRNRIPHRASFQRGTYLGWSCLMPPASSIKPQASSFRAGLRVPLGFSRTRRALSHLNQRAMGIVRYGVVVARTTKFVWSGCCLCTGHVSPRSRWRPRHRRRCRPPDGGTRHCARTRKAAPATATASAR